MALDIRVELGLTQADVQANLVYQQQRLEWRRSLGDTALRALAFEYRQAQDKMKQGLLFEIDDCLIDAWLEYKHRFGGTPQQEYVKKARAEGSRRRKSQSAKR